MLLAGRQDGELAAALAVFQLDVLALLDLRAESGQGLGHGQERNGAPTLTAHSEGCSSTSCARLVLSGLWASPEGPSSPASRAKPPCGDQIWGGQEGAE